MIWWHKQTMGSLRLGLHTSFFVLYVWVAERAQLPLRKWDAVGGKSGGYVQGGACSAAVAYTSWAG